MTTQEQLLKTLNEDFKDVFPPYFPEFLTALIKSIAAESGGGGGGPVAMGTVGLTLSGGATPLTVIPNVNVTEDSLILLTIQRSSLSTGAGSVAVTSRIVGESFTIRGISSSQSEVNIVVGWAIFNPIL